MSRSKEYAQSESREEGALVKEVSREVIGALLRESSIECVEQNIDDATLLSYLTKQIDQRSHDKASVVSLVGGAASGKSTLVKKLVQELGNADYICTDDYVVGDRSYRREHLEDGDPLHKYDFELLHEHVEHIRDLEEGGSMAVPRYNEVSGEAIAVGPEHFPHTIEHVDTLIVEGDFDPIDHPDLRIYFHVSDATRLENRVGRDLKHRAVSDAHVIRENFNGRQVRQHLPYTLEAAKRADIVIVAALEEGNDDEQYMYSVYERESEDT